jgi:hypothetical protein
LAFAPLYDQKVIQKEFGKIEITTLQRKRANEWIKKIKNKELEKEVENYQDFRDTILIELLGYPKNEIKFEEKDVEFSVKDTKGITRVVFEAKGTKTKDLFARQNYGKKEQEHPVLQTVSNMQRFAPPAAYGVCTNYNDFVLLDRELGITKCHRFTFTDIENNLDKLKEFVGIFSYGTLAQKKSLEILYEKSITAEKEFTKEFYKLYHETRLMLIRAFEDKSDVTHTEAIYYTQIFLNRLIFIFFVEDKGYVSDKQLFAKRIFGELESDQIIDISRRVYDAITELFAAFDVGSDKLGVFGFNGGLFSGTIPQKIHFLDLKNPSFFADLRQKSKLLKTTKLNEKAQKIIQRYENQLNPIISNLLIMESFDFNTEVNVNILGHIFEQSISDLETIKEKGIITKRKREGVFYTPEYITDHICRNAIIPYLSKSNASTTQELIQEYIEDIDELEKKFSKLKIVDPACGSGAFLNKAVDILLEIQKEIWNVKKSTGKFSTGKDTTLTKWSDEERMRVIIESSIYGVDINRESVEITRLSLFLKLAVNNRKLIGLSKNIVMGNSLISEKSIDERAFNWDERFPEVIHKDFEGFDGFDIIIGNPPYVSQKGTTDNPNIEFEEREYYRKTYATLSNQDLSTRGGVKLNLFALWIERCIDLLKPKGILGFIVHKNILKVESYKFLRKFILDNTAIGEIFDLGPGIFEDVTGETIIINIVKEKKKSNMIAAKENVDLEKNEYNSWEIPQNIFYDTQDHMFNIYRNEEFIKLEKILLEKTEPLEECYDVISFGLNTSDNKKYFQTNGENSSWKKAVMGRNIGKWVPKSNGYVFYDSAVLTRDGDIDTFKSEKLILQRIGTSLIAAYDDEKLYCYNSTNMIKSLKKEYSLKYLLCLLNSRLINYYYIIAFSMKAKLTVNITQGYLSQIPIKKITSDEQEPFEKESKLMIKYYDELNSERKIFADIMNTQFKITKMAKNLESFQTMNFAEFVNEIKKNSSVSFTLKIQEDIHKFFERQKQKIQKIYAKIDETDDTINELVYTLYGISKEEKKRIEEFRIERILRT